MLFKVSGRKKGPRMSKWFL